MNDTHDERGGDEAAVQPWWEMPLGEERQVAKYQACWPDFDCDHDHDEGERILRERELNGLRAQLAAATARAEEAEAERDVWKSEAERRSAERNAAVRRIGLVRECLNAPGELLPGLAELLENGTGRALSATETDADGSQGSADDRTPVRASAGLSEACGNRCDYHVCFLPAGHDGDHRDSFNWTWMTHLGTWTNDDTTEDGQHG